MTEAVLMLGLLGAIAFALHRPRLWPALLFGVALINLLALGGTARFFLDDSRGVGRTIALGLGLVCCLLGLFLLSSPRPWPAWTSLAAAALAMTLPASLLALELGKALAGATHPVAVHLGLLAAWAALAGLGFRTPPPWRGAAWALALWMTLVTLGSLRFGVTLTRATPVGGCLVMGGQAPNEPIMALTAAKPVYWLGADGQWLRWSFRARMFVWGSGPSDPVCPS